MILASNIDVLSYCASNLAYSVDLHGNFHPNPNSVFMQYIRRYGLQKCTAFANPGGDFLDRINAAVLFEFQHFDLLAFRGTLPPGCNSRVFASMEDWIQDMCVAPEKVNGLPGEVHSGIYNGYSTIKDQIFSALQENKGKILYITGHSKGGPMTSYAAFDALSDGYNVKSVVTFASPRPGDGTFAVRYDQLLRYHNLVQTRYENDLDLVPLLPPEEETAEELTIMMAEISAYFFEEHQQEWGMFFAALAAAFQIDANANYKPVGNLQYISHDYRIYPDSPSLWQVRKQQFINLFKDHWYDPWVAVEKIGAAHSVGLGGGYQKGVAPHIQ